jgi:hypothetical protein
LHENKKGQQAYEAKLWHDKDCLRDWRVLSGGKNQPFAMPGPNAWFWPVWDCQNSSKNRLHRGVHLIFSPLRFVPKIKRTA